MATKMRLYDSGKRFENYVDRYTLYFPYPKWLQKHDNVKGCFLGCSVANDGSMIRCCWDYNEDAIVNSNRCWLGKKIELSTLPKPFQRTAKRLERLWNAAITRNTDKDWERWLKA